MYRPLLCVIVVAFVTGCPNLKPKSAQELIEEQVAAMNGVTAVLDEIVSDQAAVAAIPRLEKAAARLKAANDAAARTQPKGGHQPTPEEMNQAMAAAAPLVDAALRMALAAQKAQMNAPKSAAKIRQAIEPISSPNR